MMSQIQPQLAATRGRWMRRQRRTLLPLLRRSRWRPGSSCCLTPPMRDHSPYGPSSTRARTTTLRRDYGDLKRGFLGMAYSNFYSGHRASISRIIELRLYRRTANVTHCFLLGEPKHVSHSHFGNRPWGFLQAMTRLAVPTIGHKDLLCSFVC